MALITSLSSAAAENAVPSAAANRSQGRCVCGRGGTAVPPTDSGVVCCACSWCICSLGHDHGYAVGAGPGLSGRATGARSAGGGGGGGAAAAWAPLGSSGRC